MQSALPPALTAIIKRRWVLWLGLALFWALMFVPHLLTGGFIVDDWGIVMRAIHHPRFWENYAAWFPLFSNRPAAPLLLSAVSLIAVARPWIYILVHLTMWLGGLVIIARVLGRHFSPRFRVAFLLLAALPTMASTVIFSVGMQAVGAASILLWAVSFYCLDRHLTSNHAGRWLIASYLIAFAGLLVYELSLPFLVISLLYPAVLAVEQPAQRRGPGAYLVSYILPIVGLMAGIVVLQKVIMPLWMPVYSRFTSYGLEAAVRAGLDWLWAISVELPVLLLNGARRLWLKGPEGLRLAPLAVGAAGGALLLLWAAGHGPIDRKAQVVFSSGRRLRLLLMVGLALAAASLLYLLSGSEAQVYGYLNRGLTSTWILMALVAAIGYDLAERAFWRWCLAGLVVLNIWTFLLQRDGYHRSWLLQQQVGAAVARLLAPQLALPLNPSEPVSLLGYVPAWLPDNFNDEEVVSDSWDFSGIIWYADHRLDLDAMPIRHDELTWPFIEPDQVVLKYWSNPYRNLWFFTYDAATGAATLARAPDAATLTGLVEQARAADINRAARAMPQRLGFAIANIPLSVAQRWGVLLLPVAAWLGLGAVVLAHALSRRSLRRSAARRPTGALTVAAPGAGSGPGGLVCRVCGGTDFDPIKPSDASRDPLQTADFMVTDSRYGVTLAIERCAQCGFRQCRESDDVLHFYEAMQDPAYESGRPARKQQFRAILRQLHQLAPGGRLLDVGAGTGMLVEQALALGYQAEGIEPSAWMVTQAAALGLPVLAGVLPDARLRGPYQAVTLVDVIEHVTDPAGLLGAIRPLLAADGLLLMVTPDVSSLAAQFLGMRWWHYRLAHISYFAPATLNRLLERQGYELVTIQYSGWYFGLGYLFERLGRYLPGRPKLKLPAALSRLIIPLNLFDSLLLVARPQP